METDTTNILIIGNGFDLAHGLPTTYNAFLKFLSVFKTVYTESTLTNYNYYKLDKSLQDFLSNMKHNNLLDELYKLSSENIWIDHFLKCMDTAKLKGVNWIDFESEITNVIKSLEYLKDYNEINLEMHSIKIQEPTKYAIFSFAHNFIRNLNNHLHKKKIINKLINIEDITLKFSNKEY